MPDKKNYTNIVAATGLQYKSLSVDPDGMIAFDLSNSGVRDTGRAWRVCTRQKRLASQFTFAG